MFLTRIDSHSCFYLQTVCEARRMPARIKMDLQVRHPTMEHRLISTPVPIISDHRFRFSVTGELISALKFLPQHLVPSAFHPIRRNSEMPSDD
jgi:hypothetical protein